ncbi:MAG: hypothetical protein HZC12_07185 [Nitrospirae bacterium]|nr:hypothetical protein [Nitrospirota bacterium]
MAIEGETSVKNALSNLLGHRIAFGLLWATALLLPLNSSAEVTWYFNWYCAGCSKIGARTTGTEGPFSSQSACESARSRMKSSMSRSGGGVDVMSCSSRGYESTRPDTSRPSGSRGSDSNQYPDYTPPAYDDGAERKQKQEELERRRKEEEEKARQQQEEFIRERDKAAGSLKGSGSGTFGIKGTPEGDLQIKSAAPSKEIRDISTAWRQLHCAATISLSAIDAARKDPPDLEEVRYLGEEVIKALNGDRMGVACPEKIPDPPKPYGRERLENSTLLKFYSTLMQAAVKQAQQIIDINKQITELKSKLEETKTQPRQMYQPVSASVVDLRNAKGDVVDLSVVSGDLPFKTKSEKPGIDRIVVPLPPIPADPDRPLWLQLAPRFRYFMEMEDLRDRYVKGYTIIQELRSNLALEALRAQYGIAQKPAPTSQERLDAWFEQEVNKARDRVLKEEEKAIQSLRGQSFDKMLKEVKRFQKQKKARDLQGQESAKAAVKKIEQILKQEASAIQEVRGRSVQKMTEEVMRMKEQGLYKDGDNLLEKGMTDARFRQALNQSRDRILKEEEEAIRTANRQTMEGMKKEIERLNEQGYVFLKDDIDNKKIDAARDRILKEEEKAIQTARGRSFEKLTKEIQNLQKQRERKLKEEQAQLSETQRQIDVRQTKKQQASAKLNEYRGLAQKASNVPTQAQSLMKEIK